MYEVAHAIVSRSWARDLRLSGSLWTLVVVLSVGISSGLSHAQDQDKDKQSQQNQPQQNQPQQNQPPSQSQPNQSQEPPATPTDKPSDKSTDKQKPDKQKAEKQKQEEALGPVQAAAGATKQVAQQTLIKVRDWEVGWLTGPFVGKEGQLRALTSSDRQHIYLEQTLTTPGAYLKRMFIAGIDQARGSPSQWDDGLGGYSERFASREGQFIIANTVAALGNAKLGYEVRYDQCRCTGFWPRTHHAFVRNFVTYNSSERERRPQWALYAGAFAGGLISTAWKPHPRNAFAEGGRALAGQAGWGTLLNFFIEFADDINRKLGTKKRYPPSSPAP